MITMGLLAFLVGLFVGYLSLRALGWLCVFVLVGLPLGSLGYNGVGVTFADVGCGVNLHSAAHDGAGGHYQTTSTAGLLTWDCSGSEGEVWDFVVRRGTGHGTGTVLGTISLTLQAFSGGYSSQGVLHGGCVDPYSWTGAVPTYYADGCVTNTSIYPIKWQFHAWNGTTNYTKPSGTTMPGEVWCVAWTNNAPFEYRFEWFAYHPDGTEEPIATGAGNSYWAWTNSLPTTGGSGSVGYAGNAPNNPIGGSSGAGSTNPVTGGQFASGISNLANVNYNLANVLGAGFGHLATVMSNTASSGSSGTNLDYTDWFRAISNTTAGATQRLDSILGQTGTNVFGTNFSESVAGGLEGWALDPFGLLPSMSNAWENSEISNRWYGELMGYSDQFFEATNIDFPDEADWNIFHVGVRTNLFGAGPQGINLDPRQSKWFAIMSPWVRLIWKWLLLVFAIRYIVENTMEGAMELHYIPGGGPGKGSWSWATLGVQVVVFVVVMSVIPLIVAGGYSTITTMSGGVIANPLGYVGASEAGVAQPHVRTGVGLLAECFPLAFAMTLLTYLWIWKCGLYSFLTMSARFIKHFTN